MVAKIEPLKVQEKTRKGGQAGRNERAFRHAGLDPASRR